MIKKSIKKILASMLLISVVSFISISLLKTNANNNDKKVIIEKIFTQNGNEQVIKDFYLSDGDTLILLSDDSWAIYNNEENYYMFQPFLLGDYDYSLETYEQLENIIKTYLSMCNNGYY